MNISFFADRVFCVCVCVVGPMILLLHSLVFGQDEAMMSRVVNGLKSLRHAVRLAPDVWAAMALRLSSKPEFQRFGFDIVSALLTHSSHKLPDTMWVCISKMLHNLSKNPQNL